MAKEKVHGNVGRRNAAKPESEKATHSWNLRITESEWELWNMAADIEHADMNDKKRLVQMAREVLNKHAIKVLRKHDIIQ